MRSVCASFCIHLQYDQDLLLYWEYISPPLYGGMFECLRLVVIGVDSCSLVQICTQPNMPVQAGYQAHAHNVCLSCVSLLNAFPARPVSVPYNNTAFFPSKLGRLKTKPNKNQMNQGFFL